MEAWKDEREQRIKYEQLQISISHAGEYATSTAILEL